ncbi:uncharacterized protein [Euphorbia lathyris]|uniref:uncharacterized protein n=1 Tax=Euphorbia lathyris TaxID=212925 RepID=UPI003313A4C3
MEEGGGGGRRNRDLSGLTLEAILGPQKPPPPNNPRTAVAHTPMQVNRTLLDIIRDEEPHGSLFGHKDRKSWKAFRDKLRLKRAGAAWTSTVPIPASDVPMQSYNSSNSNNNFHNQNRSLMSRRGSVRYNTVSAANPGDSDDDSSDNAAVSSSRPQMSRRTSSRYGLSDSSPSETSSFRPQMSRHNSSRHVGNPASESDDEDDGRKISEERSMSAREAIAAQEATEAEAAAADYPGQANITGGGGGGGEATMSLMDLLEETDRQMGVVGSRYTVADDVEAYDEEEEEDDVSDGGDGIEHTCCVCMVRHKGAAFIPCGHTFCRLCSRELWAQRGNCPLCNGYILEILDIF